MARPGRWTLATGTGARARADVRVVWARAEAWPKSKSPAPPAAKVARQVMIKTMRRPRDVALFPFAITVITPESHHRYCSHEISSRRRRRTTYGLVGKRLLRVYARPSSAAAARVGKGRQRPLKDDKRRDGARNLLAKDRISASLICRDSPTLATARSGKPRRKNGEGGRRVDGAS